MAAPEDFRKQIQDDLARCVLGLVQQQIAQAGTERPIIFLSGNAHVPASVQAMKAGAIDFLVKPVHSRTSMFPANGLEG
jgi:FixJ family two-component response regulator